MSATHHPEDRRAAFSGLIIGAVALLLIVTTIVHFTNQHLAAEKPAAEASK
jgi:hypothetical protein